MIKRLLNSGLWLGAAAVLSLALMQPAFGIQPCCDGTCKDGTNCMLAHYQGTSIYTCVCYVDLCSD